MGPAYSISQHTINNGALCLAVAGEVDLLAHDELLAAIQTAVRVDNVTELLIDLAAVTMLDAGGVGILLAGHLVSRAAGCGYRVLNPPDLVRRVLEVTGMFEALTRPT